jgi:hypothetical protein
LLISIFDDIEDYKKKIPHLWLEINEAIFDDIEDYKKKIYKKILELIRKLK